MGRKRMIIGITGASGTVLGIELLKAMRQTERFETHLIISRSARQTMALETEMSPDEVYALADVCYDEEDLGAAIASGSFMTDGMVVVPCSMKTLAGIACGYAENLILRAADVTLKERRKLILVARETPFSSIHLRNMLTLSDMGAVILPPMMTFYSGARSIDEMTQHIIGKIMDQFGIDWHAYRRWGEDNHGL